MFSFVAVMRLYRTNTYPEVNYSYYFATFKV
jgi:hypothetical protein